MQYNKNLMLQKWNEIKQQQPEAISWSPTSGYELFYQGLSDSWHMSSAINDRAAAFHQYKAGVRAIKGFYCSLI